MSDPAAETMPIPADNLLNDLGEAGDEDHPSAAVGTAVGVGGDKAAGEAIGGPVQEGMHQPESEQQEPSMAAAATEATTVEDLPPAPLEVVQEQQQQQPQRQPARTLSHTKRFDKPPEPKTWEIPASLIADGFDKSAFEDRLNSWRDFRTTKAEAAFERKQIYALDHPRQNINSTVHLIPYLHRTSIFQRRPVACNLMVMVMSDRECPLVNATDRLLTTVGDALQTSRAQVVAYLPNVAGTENRNCRESLYQAIRQRFSGALEIGQLHVISSPLQRDRGDAYRYAMNGLDFAYAAEFGHQYSDLFLFLQAGSRLTPEWWINYVPVPPEEGKPPTDQLQAEILTANRDYALEIMLAFEGRLRLAEGGLSHAMCYMNFAKVEEVEGKRYSDFENPTGTLFEGSDLMRLSLALRSFLPYGSFPVSELLERYCRALR